MPNRVAREPGSAKNIHAGCDRRRLLALPLAGLLMSLPAFARAAEPEFGGYCAEGLAQNMRIKTDCSVNWTGKDGKLYCFSSPGSRALFLKDPDGNLKKAVENYGK